MAAIELVIDVDYGFSLYGVVCSLREYQVAYYLNKLLNIDLEKSEDYRIEFKKGKEQLISVFLTQTEGSEIRLTRNKLLESVNGSKPFFLPELKEYDYFLQIEGELHNWSETEIEELLKESIHIQYAKQLEVENIDLKDNLIYK
jgi:hypothetical protein